MFKSALVFTLIFLVNVLVKCHITKRDVHHRIIIEEKIPRNHKPLHHHHHPHSYHDKNHHHYHDDKSSSEEHKPRKYRQNFDNNQSYEHYSAESSSYEQVRHKKPLKDKSREHYHHQHHKTINKNKYEDKQKHRHHPTRFHSEETFPISSIESYKNTDSKVHSFEDNWTPLVTTENAFHFNVNNNNNKRNNRNKKRKVKKEKKYKFPTIEFTTSYPQPIQQYSLYPAENSFASFQTTLYPPIVDNNNNFVSKFAESNTASFVDHHFPSFNSKQFEKKPNSNYEVHEPLLDNSNPQNGEITIQALMPFIGVSKPGQFSGVESKKVEVIQQPVGNKTIITNPTKRPYGKRIIRKPKGKFN